MLVTLAMLGVLAGCGGGGSGGGAGGGGNTGGGGSTAWVQGVFQPASTFADRCATPRIGAFPDVQGTTVDENNWLRSWSNDLYLWYDEIVDRNPATFQTLAYFDLLKTSALTPSGNPKDRFHFHMPTDEWEALSQSGISAGYGANWALVSPVPPREIRVAYTEPGSPATEPSIDLVRGTLVLEIDGVDAVNDGTQAGVDVLNAALFPGDVGESHTFTIRDPGSNVSRIVTITSVEVTSTPVQQVGTVAAVGGEVGYVLFNEHIATSERGLIDAVDQLRAAGIVDLVLDVRYNGGGFLDIANQLAYMLAGDAQTAGKTFETLRFNAKHPSIDPVTGRSLAPMSFIDTTVGFSVPAGQPLPTLDLSRVFVLTGPGTCSASESVINALLGIDVEVIQVGSTTCGKPYGFYPADNCGTTYFSIQFRGENHKGFGDYPDGFSPANAAGAPGIVNAGCSVADDFTRSLGDPSEHRLAAALAYRETQSCPAPSGLAPAGNVASSVISRPGAIDAIDARVHRPPGLPGKVMLR